MHIEWKEIIKSFGLKMWGGDWGARKMAGYYQNMLFPALKKE
jgi:hypothetical protein